MKTAAIPLLLLGTSMLGGCWFGITTNNSTTPVTVPDSVLPAGTAASTSYSGQNLAIFQAINSYRSKLDITGGGAGVGEVDQDTSLDSAAQHHELYLTSQPQGDIEVHDEATSGNNFYGITPHDRAVNAGLTPTTAWVGEVIGDGTATTNPGNGMPTCVSQLLSTVYHLEALTSNVQRVGIFDDPNWACVIEGATVTGTDSMSLPVNGNAEPVGGGQQMLATSVAVSPYSGEQGVLPAMSQGESPAPVLPGAPNPGHPIMLRMRADLGSDVLKVDKFELVDTSNEGASEAGIVLVSPNALATTTVPAIADELLTPCVVFFVPKVPLVSGHNYQVTFAGARNGILVKESWTFTTQ